MGEEIGLVQEKGYIILQGDFNAHTKNKDDTITPDKFDQEVELENCAVPRTLKTPRKLIEGEKNF